MSIQVSRLPVEEWEAYRALRLRALREDPEAFSSAYTDSLGYPEDFWRRRLADAWLGERSWLLFARSGNKLAGMIGAFVDEGAADTATVVSVYVPREERGKSISSRLMTEILGVLSDVAGLKRARLDVNVTQLAAIHLYQRFGFRETGRKPAVTGAGAAVEQLVMERELPVPPGE